MRVSVAYADPPYPGCAHMYRDHPDYAGEVDHRELIGRIDRDYDGWLLHTGSVNLPHVLPLCPDGVRVAAWVKSFAAFKPNVTTAYAWEPVIFKPARKRSKTLPTVRDWIMCPITLRRGLTGAKPDAVCNWGFQLLGLEPVEEGDVLHDLFPGTGAVSRAWDAWRGAPMESLAEGVQASLGGL